MLITAFGHLNWAIIGRLPSLFVTQFSSALWSIPFVERLSLPQSPVIAPTIDYCELAVYQRDSFNFSYPMPYIGMGGLGAVP